MHYCYYYSLYVQYCHTVFGMVAIAVSRLLAASGLESEEVGQDHKLANSMGLFLQKSNIIRDYLEDMQQGRRLWPREVGAVHMHETDYLYNYIWELLGLNQNKAIQLT